MALDMNDQFKQALQAMEQGSDHIFITGKAGTGKSTLLDVFRQQTKKNYAILAPTGVAAVNVRGQTIHSFFGFKPNTTPDTVVKRPKNTAIYTELDTLIIDEISMVRADLLDCVDKSLRIHRGDKYSPFGGVQMIFVGDMYQLPPVVTRDDLSYLETRYPSPYFFDSHVWSSISPRYIQFERVYRQTDQLFITLLNRVRDNTVSHLELAMLNNRYSPEAVYEWLGDYAVWLTTTNNIADHLNQEQLQRLPGEMVILHGQVTGDFQVQNAPTAIELGIKIGAQVMLLNNDTQKRWINGSLGKIMAIKEPAGQPPILTVELAGGAKVDIFPYTWDQYRYTYDDDSHKVTPASVGSFTQYPLKLAWAITIHKSQGQTFQKVIIDLGRGTFAHGQMYVALSRCTSLQGITLKQPIKKEHIKVDPRVHAFMSTLRDQPVAEQIDW